MSARLIAALSSACLLAAQPSPRFDVVSIKFNPSPAVRSVLPPPVNGRLTTRNAPLRLLIQTAYHMNKFEILGGPDWISTAGFDVEAKAEGKPTPAELVLMLQSLLEERFQLKVHREQKELPVYVMSAAKKGVKLPPPAPNACTENDPSPTRRCGYLFIAAEPGVMAVIGRSVTMKDLAKTIAEIVGRPVVDQTGGTERFDVLLRFSFDDMTVGIPRPSTSTAADVTSQPSLLVALQQEFGLKLDATKAPVEVLVVDHAQRPSEN